jgi:hypothetical protein
MSDSNDGSALGPAHRRLKQAIEGLHRSAGLPSARAISSAIRNRDDLRDTVSHETVSGILRSNGLPRWVKLECVVRQLAEWATHKPDLDSVVLEMQELWLACRRSDDSSTEPGHSSDHALETQATSVPAISGETGLRVLVEEARISYDNGAYEITIDRDLRNEGSAVVKTYDVRIVVGRYPEQPERSREHHRNNPLTWSELAFDAWCGNKPLTWRAKVDRAERKEIELLFENEDEAFPIAPGSSASLSYSYRVLDDKWGNWFSRRAFHPIDQLVIIADFPEGLRPVVWGERVDPLMNEAPLRVPVRPQRGNGGRLTYRWVSKEVYLRRIYRLEWGFRTLPIGLTEGV